MQIDTLKDDVDHAQNLLKECEEELRSTTEALAVEQSRARDPMQKSETHVAILPSPRSALSRSPSAPRLMHTHTPATTTESPRLIAASQSAPALPKSPALTTSRQGSPVHVPRHVSDAGHRVEMLEAENAGLARDIEELHRNATAAQTIINRLQGELRQAQDAAALPHRELESKSKMVIDLQTQAQEWSAHSQQYIKQIEALQASIGTWSQRCAELKEQAVSQERHHVERERQLLADERAQWKTYRDEQREELQRVQREHQTHVATLMAQVQQARAAEAAALATVVPRGTPSLQTVDATHAELETARVALVTATARATAAEAAATDATAAYQATLRQLDTASQDLLTLRRSLDTALAVAPAAETDALVHRVAELQAQVQRVEEELQAAHEVARRQRVDLAAAQQTIATLSAAERPAAAPPSPATSTTPVKTLSNHVPAALLATPSLNISSGSGSGLGSAPAEANAESLLQQISAMRAVHREGAEVCLDIAILCACCVLRLLLL